MRCGRRSQHRAAAALAVAATDDVVAATDVVAAAGHGLIKQPLFGLWDIFRRRDRIVRDSVTRWSKQAPSALLEIRRRNQHRAAATLAVAATDDVVAATDVVAAAGHGLIKQPLFGL